ncbi:2,3,4,5-tetrahydropyridine-2,6-dicarboxylate N-acetyltransferase [Ligilactobacillus sp. LYQ60]|uniref:2,3,4,5-tetrahydropyridine-2,6-dicarboxylate N-acetyltransferase n=1 Tax=unclassified Ligilactobacillus TaxID=2767920 RepID=UPI003853DD85
MKQMNTQEIINYIGNAPKTTPVRVYLQGKFTTVTFPAEITSFHTPTMAILIGDWGKIKPFITAHATVIETTHVEVLARNSAVPLLDYIDTDARIEPGAIIRDQVKIGNRAVIMMGAIINIGAVIGEESMIDMGVVLGGRAQVGRHCHIGAGSVLAGVIEPASAQPVVIEDNVMVGANAVVLEGVRVGYGAVIAAGAVVTHDVAPNTVVAGVPARIIKKKDNRTANKTALEDELRGLD